MRVLLEAGADPNAASRGRTPLSAAVLHGETGMVATLLEHGALPDTIYRDAAPLHVAAGRGLLSECRLLVQHGADVSLLSTRYGTPLHVAVRLNHQFIARFLVEAGARYDLLNADGAMCPNPLPLILKGESVTFVAAKAGRAHLIELFLSNSITVRRGSGLELHNKFKYGECALCEPHEGLTPLHIAARNNADEVVGLLLKKFPRLATLRNTDGKSPLFFLKPSLRKSARRQVFFLHAPSPAVISVRFYPS